MGERFVDFLNEQLRDPDFQEVYEKISADEDARLASILAACTCPPPPYRDPGCPVHAVEQPSS